MTGSYEGPVTKGGGGALMFSFCYIERIGDRIRNLFMNDARSNVDISMHYMSEERACYFLAFFIRASTVFYSHDSLSRFNMCV